MIREIDVKLKRAARAIFSGNIATGFNKVRNGFKGCDDLGATEFIFMLLNLSETYAASKKFCYVAQ